MTVMGPVTFNPDGTGKVIAIANQWQDGKQVLVWPKDQASGRWCTRPRSSGSGKNNLTPNPLRGANIGCADIISGAERGSREAHAVS